MKICNIFLNIQKDNHQLVLLYRLHLLVGIINIFAMLIDSYAQKYLNVSIEAITLFMLFFNLIYLYKNQNITKHLHTSAYLFITIVSTSLFILIYLNHFATMSVIFILLLPLTTLLFLSIKETILLSVFFMFIMAILLYIDSLNNTRNLFATNPMALFNLLYTLIIIYSFGFLYHFAILKTFQELDNSNKQKAFLLKEVHHRVKNNLNVIASIIGLQEHTLEGKGKEELLKSKARIESIAIVHEMLYRDEDFQNIHFESYMHRLSQLLLSMYVETHSIKVHIKSSIDSLSLNIMVQLGIMINEFFTNSIKYAFPINTGDIYIDLDKDEASYILTYYDNGIGHPSPQTLLSSPSLGIKLIHLTARQLKGSVKLSSSKGLKYEIRFQA